MTLCLDLFPDRKETMTARNETVYPFPLSILPNIDFRLTLINCMSVRPQKVSLAAQLTTL